MEIKIRGIDVGTVAIFDEEAKKINLSRNEWLKQMLENIAWSNRVSLERIRMEEVLNNVLLEQKRTQFQMDQIKKLLCLVADVNEEEIIHLFKE